MVFHNYTFYVPQADSVSDLGERALTSQPTVLIHCTQVNKQSTVIHNIPRNDAAGSTFQKILAALPDDVDFPADWGGIDAILSVPVLASKQVSAVPT